MRTFPHLSVRIASTSMIALALSLSSVSAAFAGTDFAFGALDDTAQDHVTVFVGEDEPLSGAAADVNNATDGRLKQALEDADFSGKFGKILKLYSLGSMSSVTVIASIAFSCLVLW